MKVKVTCCGKTKIYESKKQALAYFKYTMQFCDTNSNEFEIYERIVEKLQSGNTEVDDIYWENDKEIQKLNQISDNHLKERKLKKMKITQKIPPAVIQAATAMLSPYVPEISTVGLLEAIKSYSIVPEPERKEYVKPYTRQEVCDLLGVSLPTVHRMVNRGVLRRIKVGIRTVRIDPKSVQELLDGKI